MIISKEGLFQGLKGTKIQKYSDVNKQINDAKDLFAKDTFDFNTAKQKGITNEVYQYIEATDRATVSTEGFYEALTKNSHGLVNATRLMNSYNKISKQDSETKQAFINGLAKNNAELADNIDKAAKMGGVAELGIKNFLNSITSSLKTGLLDILFSFLVSGIIRVIEEAVYASEKRIQKLKSDLEKASNTADTFDEESDAIDMLQSRYTEIITSTQDLKTAKEELRSIQDELNEAYGKEVKNLDLINKSYGENLQLLIEQNRKRAKKYVGSEEEPNKNRTNYNNAIKQLEEGGRVELITTSNGGVSYAKYGNYAKIHASGIGNFSSVNDILKQYDVNKVLSGANAGRTSVEGDNDIYFFGSLEEQLENMESVYSKLSKRWENKKSNSKEQEWLSALNDEIERVKEEIKTSQNIIKTFEANEKIAKSTGQISSYIDSVTSATQKYLNSNSTSEKIAAIEEVKKFKEIIYNANKDENGKIIDQDIQDKLDEYFDGIDTTLDGRINGINDELQIYKQTLANFTNETYETVNNGLEKFDTAISSLRNGSVLDDSTVLELISLDPKLADSFTNVAGGYAISLNKIETARKEFYKTSIKDIQTEINGLNEQREKLEQERSVYFSQFGSINGIGDVERFNSGLKNIDDKITDTKLSIAQWQFYLSSIGAQLTPIEESLLKISDIQELVSAQWSLSNGLTIDDSVFSKYPELLSYVNDTKKLYEEIGKIIDRIRNNAFKGLFDSGYTEQQISGAESLFAKSDFTQLIQQAEEVSSSLNTLQSAYESISNNDPLDVTWFEDFPDLAKYAGDTKALQEAITEKLSDLPEKMLRTIEKYKKENQEVLTVQEKERLTAIEIMLIQAKITNERKVQTSLITEQKNKAEEELEILNKQRDALEETISQYESAANAIINAIDDEIEKLEEGKVAIEEKYNAEIEALQKENEERDRSNALREKELALEKAKNDKVRVYSAARGWTIQTNSEAAKAAQKEYDDQVNSNKIAELEEQRDAETKVFDERIKEYEDYKEMWQDALNEYQNMQDEMNAAALFGANWRTIAINRDVSAIGSFVSSYGFYQEQLNQMVNPEIERIQSEIDKYNEKIDALDRLQQVEEDYFEHYKNYIAELPIMAVSDSVATGAEAIVKSAQNGNGFKFLQGAETTSEAMTKFNNFMNSGSPASLLGGASLTNLRIASGFKGVVDKMVGNHAANVITQKSGNVINNQYGWTITGNEINADKYETFKGYMDRYVREAQMNLSVGKK